VINLVSTVAINAIKKNIAVVCAHNTDIDKPNNSGLKVQKTEKPITCLNIVITNVAKLKVINNPIKFIGNPFAIRVSTICDITIHPDVF
jgi:hypothetical protein